MRKRRKPLVNQLWLKYLTFANFTNTYGHVNKLQEPGWAFASEEYWSLISISIRANLPLLMNCRMWLNQWASLSSPAFSLTWEAPAFTESDSPFLQTACLGLTSLHCHQPSQPEPPFPSAYVLIYILPVLTLGLSFQTKSILSISWLHYSTETR